jgi:FAD-dependent urate hydroxylase
VSDSECQAAIIGAGPYGLAIAAHLFSRGVHTHVLGEPMEFWQRRMPRGMLLRSSKRSSSIGNPNAGFCLDDYVAQAGSHLADRIPLEDFIAYGCWFQRGAAPECDHRRVSDVVRASNGFRVLLEDGDTVRAKYLIVAAGIGPFAHIPEAFAGLPSEKASHSSEHTDFRRFVDKRVVVVGAGQSAFESAALLLESGAEVDIIVRTSRVIWLSGANAARRLQRGFLSMIDPGTDVGPLGLDQIAARPRLFASLPYRLQVPIAYRCVRPAVSAWLSTRVARVRITTSTDVTRASASGNSLKIELSDGKTRVVDHLLLATGYHVDISRYSFINRNLYRSISRLQGYPLVNRWFESSVEGLFFAGAPAALSLGPLFRFVAGTQYCARCISEAIALRLGLRPRQERAFAADILRASQ